MSTAKVNEIEMYYETHGQGEPLLMLHGFCLSSQMWSSFIQDFKDHFQLIIPDLRGHGRSTNPSRKFTHRQAALDVFALLDHLGIGRFKAIGYSSGGMTLIHMATQQPNRMEAMVLISATSYFPKSCREIMAQYTVENLSREERDYYRKIHFYGDEQIRLLIEQFHNMKDSYNDMNFTSPFLSTITAKTLIIHGDRDPYIPISIATDMYNSIHHAYLWIIPNFGHDRIVSKHASEIKSTALEFLKGGWDKSGDI